MAGAALFIAAWIVPHVAIKTFLGALLVSLVIAVYPIVDVTSRGAYAAKISAVVLVTNLAGVLIYRAGKRRGRLAVGQANVSR